MRDVRVQQSREIGSDVRRREHGLNRSGGKLGMLASKISEAKEGFFVSEGNIGSAYLGAILKGVYEFGGEADRLVAVDELNQAKRCQWQ